jgi:nucleoside-diphosphate-sugar epimerase
LALPIFPQMPSIKVALAGATGNLGVPILEALLAAQISVTVLSRLGGNSSKLTSYPNLKIEEVDFESAQSLTVALQGVEVVVSCVATLAIGSQNRLIDASVAAGVKRFIPAEFGMNSLDPLCARLPVCVPKVTTQRYLQEKSRANRSFSWTGIANGVFLDWGMKVGFIVNPHQHTATLYNGGNIPFSATKLTDVAKAVLAVIDKQEQTANRLLYIQSTVITQNQLIEYAKNVDGKEWQTREKSTEEVRKESYIALDRGDTMTAMDGFCVTASWDTDYGCDFSSHLDNELLGVKMLDEAELRLLVESFLE